MIAGTLDSTFHQCKLNQIERQWWDAKQLAYTSIGWEGNRIRDLIQINDIVFRSAQYISLVGRSELLWYYRHEIDMHDARESERTNERIALGVGEPLGVPVRITVSRGWAKWFKIHFSWWRRFRCSGQDVSEELTLSKREDHTNSTLFQA